MEEGNVADEAIYDPNKYRRVFPIIGLLLYYLGSLILSLDLDLESSLAFLLQIALFSIILTAGLQWPPNKIAVIIGAILVIIASAGPIVNLIFSIQDGLFSFSVLGGSIVLLGVIFQIGTIIIWLKEPW